MALITVPGTTGTLQSHPAIIALRVPFDEPNISKGILKCTVMANVGTPIVMEFQPEIIEVFNAGNTNDITLGTTSQQSNEIFQKGDINSGVLGFGITKKFRFTTNTELWLQYKPTGTAPTKGFALIYLKIFPITTL